MSAAISKTPPLSLFQFAADRWSQPFWDAAREHRLVVARCADCGRLRMPPTPFCPNCNSQALEWPELSGAAVLYSYTVVDRAVLAEMAESLPYVPIVVEFPDAPGVRLVSCLVGAPVDALAVGAKLQVMWEDLPQGIALPRFRLVG